MLNFIEKRKKVTLKYHRTKITIFVSQIIKEDLSLKTLEGANGVNSCKVYCQKQTKEAKVDVELEDPWEISTVYVKVTPWSGECYLCWLKLPFLY